MSRCRYFIDLELTPVIYHKSTHSRSVFQIPERVGRVGAPIETESRNRPFQNNAAQSQDEREPGRITLGLSLSCGKSLGFRVMTKSAVPSSSQRQKGSSFGSGEISVEERSLTSSARSRIRLTTRPIRFGRTWRRFRTSLYSSRMSSVMSHTKWFFSAHHWRRSALGVRP